jgi:hypothetical protein
LASLEGADLGGARLEGADLQLASLEGASLRYARLEGADLQWAWLEGADFRGVNWAGASSGASPAQLADFRGGQDLKHAQLDQMIGHDSTLLPDGPAPDTAEPYRIWTCWRRDTPPEGFDVFVALAPRSIIDTPEAIRAEFLCPEGEAPQPTGTPCALQLTREQCLDPAQNPHHPANRPR